MSAYRDAREAELRGGNAQEDARDAAFSKAEALARLHSDSAQTVYDQQVRIGALEDALEAAIWLAEDVHPVEARAIRARMLGDVGDDRPPTKIVASSPSQSRALAAFIGQELERWGFAVENSDGGGRKLTVNAHGYEFRVEVTRFR